MDVSVCLCIHQLKDIWVGAVMNRTAVNIQIQLCVCVCEHPGTCIIIFSWVNI